MTELEKDFYEFLVAWRAWAKAGALTPQFIHGGLCSNYDITWPKSVGYLGGRRKFLLDLRLKEFDSKWVYPFNDGLDDYYNEMIYELSHRNRIRLAWVTKKIRQYKKEMSR